MKTWFKKLYYVNKHRMLHFDLKFNENKIYSFHCKVKEFSGIQVARYDVHGLSVQFGTI